MPLASDVETALLGETDTAVIDAWIVGVVAMHLGTRLERVAFRAGRIDAVYGLALADGRSALLKVHRPPVAVEHLRAVDDGLRQLHAHGYPCPEPLAEPVVVDGRTVTVRSLLSEGSAGDARRPEIRRAMTRSLAEHIEILTGSGVDALAPRLGPGPAWTRHAGGPWPVPHDTAFDFSATPTGWEWLDDYARGATAQLRTLRGTSARVVAHPDWYAGNLRFADDRVVATFDWDLYVEEEAVVVGLVAGGYLADDAPSPTEVVAFLDDYAQVRPLQDDARRAAVAAARWMLAFNARCDLATLAGEPVPGSALDRLVVHRDTYSGLED